MLKSQSAFNKIFREHKRTVENVVFRITNESVLDDLVQETFIKVWRSLPYFCGKSTIKTWIYRIAVNVSLDHCRKRARPEGNFDLTERTGQEERADNSQIAQMALQTLSLQERSIVALFYFEELSIEEISQMLESPQGTIKSKLSRAKQKMRQVISEELA